MEGYNQAINNTDAKYKVFINEGSLILNIKFIFDMLNIFEDPKIGMIGVRGAKTIPTNGSWVESKNKVGKVFVNSKILEENDIGSILPYEEVKLIDGSIMITQYDISWREDIFKDKYFYDSAQCVEFSKNSFKIVVLVILIVCSSSSLKKIHNILQLISL